MEDYLLQGNEAVLYKGRASFESGNIRNTSEILLTNINLVAIIRTKKIFQTEQVEVKTYPVSEIKMYNGIPQVKEKNGIVEIYFANTEVKLNFYSKISAIPFMNAANKLITGKSMSERGAEKFKGAVSLVDDTLGIKSVETMKGVLENGVVGAVFGGTRKKGNTSNNMSSVANTIADVVSVTKGFIGDKTTDSSSARREEIKGESLSEQIEAIKELKGLVDTGILTQEEFDAKKKQIMGL